ncbi:MAG TPA: carboxypeptidase-like regulatory domain-containing protein [Candidatus Acidoferrum sp.]|nr:carboxypeptidase-like regulatory domain-containing protein [Candidatus Acidoferrum sp.]
MKPKAAGVVFSIGLVLIVLNTFLLNPEALGAQEASATLSGIVTDPTGRALLDVKVSAKNLSTGQSIELQTDSSGQYSFPTLTPGDYEVSVSAYGFAALTVKATITGEGQKALNLTVQPSASGRQIDTSQGLPNAPSSSKTEPSLEDLGFSKSETQSNAAQQALLDKRTHMLKIHQRMGLITTIPLAATVILGPGAGGKSEGTATRDLHVALGSLTGDLYGITAWYAIRAPRIKGTEKRGPIRFHEAMAWIHGPGMILTPILGAMAFEQKNNGEKVHGVASAHGAVAIVTAGAFGAALLSVSVKF